ncbi:DNA internalization-related competence protein ComEC/Rec2 [Thiomicrorhabdus lithotrophica]|uniref:DNA internalization-related competence protein ComEC/Rec2 n=1 Tax=Thiomicrorhabdus lithotrophica TaxID=2949997 RepID=A0ABY8CC50_9GAMM|nr:DNA internalization-related competence protein ComEC/Rec2 [Thiomicrorhabdus lithotrophica]WEJ63554.1 DNA internalization-related competence protein ComEC/Rec2 [Thiomicrorhabdus lithotrophica]
MFIQFVIGVVVTTILCYQLTNFPPLWVGWLLVVLMTFSLLLIMCLNTTNKLLVKYFCSLSKKFKIIKQHTLFFNLLLSIVFAMNLVFWQGYFSPKIDSYWYNKPTIIEAKITNIPTVVKAKGFYKIAFEADLQKVSNLKKSQNHINDQAWSYRHPRIKINWYLSFEDFKQITSQPTTGEVWQFYAKLRANHAAMNSGGRDYEAWLFHNHIDAKASVSGLVTKTNKNTGLAQSKAVKLIDQTLFDLSVWRFNSSVFLQEILVDSPYQSIYNALLIGDKSQITDKYWKLFHQTGTIHLMAISGLHMGIMAIIGFWVFKLFWWLGLYRLQSINLPTLTAIGAVLFATAYLIVSGGAIPTQRAWIMVMTILGFLWIRRSFQPWSALAMAALLVIVWDSRAVLSTGFWLSFSAVAIIFFSLRLFKDKPKWQQLVAMQFMLSAGLAPLILWNFYEVALYGLLANLIAVPFVTLIGLPGLFLGVVLGIVSVSLGQSFIKLLDWFWAQLWAYLDWVTRLPNIEVTGLEHSISWLIFSVFSFLLIYFIFQKLNVRYGLSVWILPGLLLVYFLALVFYPYSLPRPSNEMENKQAWLTVLDVGQGQAIVIETANHVMVYDTGAKWGETTDAAKTVVLPYLKSQGWQQVDMLMISHSDLDHAGGTQTVLDNIKVIKRLSGQPNEVNKQLSEKSKTSKTSIDLNAGFVLCHSDQAWWFDNVYFEVLSPFSERENTPLKSDNDLSCVLKISNNQYSVLITGDLSQKGEKFLMEKYQTQPQKLQADLLVAGHHGSKSSTSKAWLEAVNPNKVVFSAGYLNRYKFPNTEVIKRIENLNFQQPIKWWNTACSGGVSFELNNLGVDLRYETRKNQRKWYHHSCLQSQQGTYFQ